MGVEPDDGQTPVTAGELAHGSDMRAAAAAENERPRRQAAALSIDLRRRASARRSSPPPATEPPSTQLRPSPHRRRPTRAGRARARLRTRARRNGTGTRGRSRPLSACGSRGSARAGCSPEFAAPSCRSGARRACPRVRRAPTAPGGVLRVHAQPDAPEPSCVQALRTPSAAVPRQARADAMAQRTPSVPDPAERLVRAVAGVGQRESRELVAVATRAATTPGRSRANEDRTRGSSTVSPRARTGPARTPRSVLRAESRRRHRCRAQLESVRQRSRLRVVVRSISIVKDERQYR